MGKIMLADESIARVVHTLEVCAESLGDIVPMVFAQFFAMDKEAHQLMAHSDQHMQGRMFESVLDLLMSDEHFAPGGYLDWELDNHMDAYSATLPMYQAFFAAIKDVVETGVGDAWSAEDEKAWQMRIELVLSRVQAHGEAHADLSA